MGKKLSLTSEASKDVGVVNPSRFMDRQMKCEEKWGEYSVDTSIARWIDGDLPAVVIKAVVSIDEGKRVGVGHAYQKAKHENDNGFVGHAETLALGRAYLTAIRPKDPDLFRSEEEDKFFILDCIRQVTNLYKNESEEHARHFISSLGHPVAEAAAEQRLARLKSEHAMANSKAAPNG